MKSGDKITVVPVDTFIANVNGIDQQFTQGVPVRVDQTIYDRLSHLFMDPDVALAIKERAA